ncbi:hypothetical protein FHY09_001467 [Xanthomonas sp. 60]
MLDYSDPSLGYHNTPTVMGVVDGKRQSAALKLDISTSNDRAIAGLNLVERSDNSRLRVHDRSPAMVHSSESLQAIDLLGMALIVGRYITKELAHPSIGLCWKLTNRRVGIQVVVDQPDLNGIAQLFDTFCDSVYRLRVAAQGQVAVSCRLQPI